MTVINRQRRVVVPVGKSTVAIVMSLSPASAINDGMVLAIECSISMRN